MAHRRIERVQGNEWYLNGDQFDLRRITSGWSEKLSGVLARGYEGMRVSGNSSKEAARALGISPRAVEFHRDRPRPASVRQTTPTIAWRARAGENNNSRRGREAVQKKRRNIPISYHAAFRIIMLIRARDRRPASRMDVHDERSRQGKNL
jgi:hypothetical protein